MKKPIVQSQYITVLLLALCIFLTSCDALLTLTNTEGKITALTVTLNGVDHTVDFNGGLQAKVTYYYTTGTSIDTITIKQITISDKATASVSNGQKIAINNNTVRITITAENKTKQVYIITVSAQSVEASIKGIVERGSIPGDLTDPNARYTNTDRQVLRRYKVGAVIKPLFFTVEGKGTKDGSSWANALPATTLKSKMNDIHDASIDRVYLILIASGTYKAGQELNMKNHVAIIGGWEKVGGWNKPASEHTILSGDNSYRIFNNANINSTATLYNVTIINGMSGSSGGGMHNTFSSPSIISVTFRDNQAARGGGMYNSNSSPSILYSTFSNNKATQDGGGIYNINAIPYINTTTLTGNKATKKGGGIYNSSSSYLCINTTLADNEAEQGGGICNFDSPGQIIINATFSKNKATQNGGALYNDNNSPSRPTIILNSILWGNTAPPAKGPQIFVNNMGTQDEAITLGYGIINNGGDGTGVQKLTDGSVSKVTVNDIEMRQANPNLEDLRNNEGPVETIRIPTTSSAKDLGVYVGAHSSNNQLYLYYSKNKTTWYTDVKLSNQVTPPANTIIMTFSDATGLPRSNRPDAGAYEAR